MNQKRGIYMQKSGNEVRSENYEKKKPNLKVTTREKLKLWWYTAKSIHRNEKAGSVVEYALILGFALLLFIVIVGIVLSIVDMVETQFNELFKAI